MFPFPTNHRNRFTKIKVIVNIHTKQYSTTEKIPFLSHLKMAFDVLFLSNKQYLELTSTNFHSFTLETQRLVQTKCDNCAPACRLRTLYNYYIMTNNGIILNHRKGKNLRQCCSRSTRSLLHHCPRLRLPISSPYFIGRRHMKNNLSLCYSWPAFGILLNNDPSCD